MKGVFAVVLFCVGVVCYVVGVRVGQSQEHQKQITAVSDIQSAATSANLETQAKCAKQAQETFMFGGWNKKPSSTFFNHYNVQLNRCFVEIDDNGDPWTDRTVSDAFEGVTYASYSWKVDERKKYWEVPPFACWVNDASGKKQRCNSVDEFDALLKPYLTK